MAIAVTRSPCSLVEDRSGPRFGRLPTGQHACRVKVALDPSVVAHPAPGRGQRNTMVDADDVALLRSDRDGALGLKRHVGPDERCTLLVGDSSLNDCVLRRRHGGDQ